MNEVAILDQRAKELAKGFNDAAANRTLSLRFQSFAELDHLYCQIEREAPALILMHHTWEGLDTASIVNHIASHAEHTRVIVFTGRDLNLPELIQCVRCGVADYWETGKHTIEFMLNRIVQCCSDSNSTLGRLRKTSGPMLQLLEKAGSLEEHIRELERANGTLRESLRSVRSAHHKRSLSENVKTVRFIVYFLAFTTSFMALRIWTNIETWALLVFEVIVATYLLLSDGRLARALFKWTDGMVDLRGVDRRENGK